MPEDKKDPFSEFGGKEISSTENNKPSSDPFSEFGGSSLPEKKKSTPSPSTSVSEDGTSGLTATPSASPSTPTETYGVKPGSTFDPFSKAPTEVKGQTALGNKLNASTDLKSVGTSLGGKPMITDSNIAKNQAKEQYDQQTKSMVDVYDKYKQSKSTQQASLGKEPFALDDNKNTIDFYMSHIKETNPEEYNYMLQKQESMSKDKKANELSGNFEDAEEDELMIQKSHAELLQKALALKTRVMSGKYDVASNAVKDNYGDVIKNLNESVSKSEDLGIKIKGIDDFISQNYEVDENGQILTTPKNRKEVEDLLSKRTEFLNEYNSQSENIKGIQENKDFSDAMSLLDETQKTYDSLEKTYTDIKNKNPDAFKGLPSYRKLLIDEQQAQFSKDLSEEMTGGNLGITEGTGRGATGIVSALSFIPKSVSFNEDYGWTDKLYDVVKSNVDDFDAENNPLPTGYDKPVYENGQWNLKYLPGKIAGTLTEMAPIIAITAATEGATAGMLARMGASGELGTTLGSFAGEYVAVANDFYDEAKSAGMSENEAMSFSRSAATTQAVLGALSPDIKLMRNNAFKEGLDTYAKQISKGVSVKDAIKESTKGFAEKLIKEVPQENLQTWAEIQDKNDMYEKMGLNEKIQNSVKKDLIETTILSTIVTLGLGAGSVKTPSRMQQESIFMAASQPEEIMMAAQNMLNTKKISPQEFNDITMKVAKANFALSKIDKSLSAEKKIKALIPLMEKLDLKEEAANLDDSQKELMNEKIAKKDAEIKGIVSSPSDEEIQDANEAESFFNRIKEQHTKDNTPEVKIPEEENKMQKEGLFEVDDSQKSQPIELSTQPENVIATPGEIVEEPKVDEKSSEDKIAEVNKAIKENKLNFFNEKIDNNTYWKNQDSLEKDLANLENPSAKKTETLTPEEVIAKETPTIEDVKPLEPEVKTEEVRNDVKEFTGTREKLSKSKTGGINLNRDGKSLLDMTENPEHIYRVINENQLNDILENNSLRTPSEAGKKGKNNFRETLQWYKGHASSRYGNIAIEAPNENYTIDDLIIHRRNADGSITSNTVAELQGKAAPKETTTKKETPSPKTATQISAEQNMLDEEDVVEASDKEDIATVKKMNDDAEIIKGFSKENYKDKSTAELKDLVEKKYIGTLERAYKAKIDGKISKPTYTEYRNKLNDIISGKLAEYSEKKVKGGGQEGESLRKGELKAQVSALGEKVKEKLLGQGIKNAALSSAVPVTPKMIEDLVNLTVKGVHLGIDLGYGVREATARAITAIKAHPKYQQVINSGMSEKDFAKSVNAEFSKAKSTYVPPVVAEETTTEKPVESTTSEKTTESTGSAQAPETETTENKGASEPKKQMTSSEFETGETAKRKMTERLEGSEKYNNILASMKEEDKSYDVMTLSELYNVVKKKISEFERAGKLSELAIDLLDPKRTDMFPPEAIPELLTQLGDRFNSIAEEETNEFVKQELYNLAAELMTSEAKLGTTTGKTMAAMRLAAERMPTSRAGLKTFVNKQMNNVADASMSEKNKAERDAAVKELVDLQVKEKLSEIAEGTKGKDQVAKIKTELSSLKIDLKDC